MSVRLKWPSGSRMTPPRFAAPKRVDSGVCQSHECGMRCYASMHFMGAVSEFHPLRLCKKEDDFHHLHHLQEREDPSPDINISSIVAPLCVIDHYTLFVQRVASWWDESCIREGDVTRLKRKSRKPSDRPLGFKSLKKRPTNDADRQTNI